MEGIKCLLYMNLILLLIAVPIQIVASFRILILLFRKTFIIKNVSAI